MQGRGRVRWRRVLAIARKDWRAVRRSRSVLAPLIVVPLVIYLAIPVAFSFIPRLAGLDEGDQSELELYTRLLPAAQRVALERLEPAQQLVVILVGYQLVPLFLIVPLMVAMVIAADAIAGERERRTLEALLVTPLRESELFLGKVLVAAVPAIVLSLAGTVLAHAVVILLTGVGPPLLPNPAAIVLTLVGGPAVITLGLGVVVLVSARVRGTQEVYQLSGVVVVPLIGLIVAQSSGLFLLTWWLAVLGSLLTWIIGGLLLRVAYDRVFQREALLRLV